MSASAGAAQYLQEECSHLTKVPLLGASAGSIAASLLLSNASFYDAAKLAIRQTEERDLWNSQLGLAGVWGPMVRDFLNDLIPLNLTHSELSRINICITPRSLIRGTKVVSNFSDKADLVDAVMASVHIPVFMDGRLWSNYQGKKYIDGSFWSFVLRRKSTLPRALRHVKKDKVLHVDFHRDRKFVASLKSSNMVKLIKPDGLYEMMDFGYEYMRNHMGNRVIESTLELPK
eukprot:gene30008-36243_t